MAAPALGLALGAALLFGGPPLMQDRLLYFPAKVSVAQASAGGLQPWPSATAFRGLLAPAPAAPRGSRVDGDRWSAVGHIGIWLTGGRALIILGGRILLNSNLWSGVARRLE